MAVRFTILLCGDVMTGRGVDQILDSPGDPRLWESAVDDARDYVRLAEIVHGPIHRPVPPSWIWGDALAEFDRVAPDARAAGTPSSGVPPAWAARDGLSGVAYLPDLSDAAAESLLDRIMRVRSPGAIVVVSIHWGSNWGYDVPDEQVRFAHGLVRAGVDLVHGHSSHHPRRFEVYRDRLILYGCGDFVDDYEGIGGYGEYRDDLRPAYFASLDSEGRLESLRVVVYQSRRLRLQRAAPADVRDMARMFAGIGSPVRLHTDGSLMAGAQA